VRLILDTCVIVSAFRSPRGPSHRLLRIFDEGRYELLASTAHFLEYEAVLSRPEQVAVHQLTPHQLDGALRELADRIQPVAVGRRYRPQLTDPNDEMVLEAAIDGFAEAIVTHNTRDFLPAARSFGVEVITPGSILQERFSR
jgi:predicted nucleic acid-binding protein